MDLQETYWNLLSEGPVTALYLDDCRTPRPNMYFTWVIVRSYAEFTNYIRQQGMPPFLSFDHDLGYTMPEFASALEEEEAMSQPLVETPCGMFRPCVMLDPTGLDCAKWLANYCLDNDILMPLFSVHSANPAGAENILHLLNNLRQHQGQDPVGWRTVW